jgi:hypothetical protein
MKEGGDEGGQDKYGRKSVGIGPAVQFITGSSLPDLLELKLSNSTIVPLLVSINTKL